MVKKIPDINEVPSGTQETELPKIPSYQNLRDDVRESFEWLMKSVTLQSISMDELGKQDPKGGVLYYHIPEHDTYITIHAAPMLYNPATIQYSIAVYGKLNKGFFYTIENPTQPIGEKLQELVLGLRN